MNRPDRFDEWKLADALVAAALFFVAAWRRFSLPQTPLIDTDYGYLWPVLSKLAGGASLPSKGSTFSIPARSMA